MAEMVLGFLLKELSTFLHAHQPNLGEELQREIQFIRDELGSMRAFLRDAEAKDDDVAELQEWVRQVREIAYDTEDVLDELVMRFDNHRADGCYGRVQKIYTSIKNMRARRRISSNIKDIEARVEDISARHQRYQSTYDTWGREITSSMMKNTDYDIRSRSLLIEESKLVAIDKPKRELISQILDGHSSLKVVSVVGMGGLGKTTLVKKVYDDVAVKRQFQCHAWLTISQTFHIMTTIKNLIQQLYDENLEPVPAQVEFMDEVRLSAFVKDFLQEKRYILVLDDVWSTDTWDAVKYVLPDCNLGNRVLLTTRIADVGYASCIESHDYVHRMEPLSDEDSWTLFGNRIFQRRHCPRHLVDVSRSILKKCEGLPLAIVAISGVLALKNKDRTDEWELILGSLGGEPEDIGKLDKMRRILLLSFYDLPHYLKSCLLYLSVYPEDYEIFADDLQNKWIAQGFIQEIEGMSPTDIARGYARELINRSLIQVASTSDDGTILSYHIHDFLREIIIAKSREQNFTSVAAGYYHRRSSKVRRLAIHDFVDNPQTYEPDGCFENLRSLEIFGYTSPLSTSVLSKFLCRSSKLLKVLDLSGAPLENIPNKIFKLFHLNYLCLRGTQVRIIPKSIGKLQNLEVLDLSHTNVTEIPAEILKLRKLHYLAAGEWGDYSKNYATRGFKSPSGIGKLLLLEVLEAVEVDNDKKLKEISALTKLRRLSITKLRREDGEELVSLLMKLTNLRELYVCSTKEDETLQLQFSVSQTPRFLDSLVLEGRLERVPQWLVSLQALTTLRLQHSGLSEDDAPGGIGSLQVLPSLVSLTLNHAYEGETLNFKAGGFQKLRYLELSKLTCLKCVRVEEDSMPSLQRLVMAGCKRVEALPLGTKNLRSLRFLQLLDMSDVLIQKVQNLDKQSEEYQTIAGIPEVRMKYWKDGHWHDYFP